MFSFGPLHTARPFPDAAVLKSGVPDAVGEYPAGELVARQPPLLTLKKRHQRRAAGHTGADVKDEADERVIDRRQQATAPAQSTDALPSASRQHCSTGATFSTTWNASTMVSGTSHRQLLGAGEKPAGRSSPQLTDLCEA